MYLELLKDGLYESTASSSNLMSSYDWDINYVLSICLNIIDSVKFVLFSYVFGKK